MRMRRWIGLILALTLLMAALPTGAMAKSKPSIKLNIKLGLLYADGTGQLTAKLKRVSAADVTVTSSDTSVATVTDQGLVTGVAPGLAVITASGGGAKAQCGVVVLPRAISVKVGERVSLPCGKLEKYKVKQSSIASVSKKGVVTGKKAGTTVLAVKYKKQTLTIDVTVTDDAGTQTPAADAPADSVALGSRAAQLDAASQTDQIVLVEYTGGSSARLSVHEKIDGVWTQLLETSAYVGRNGIGKTKEGDKKTPIGTYNLTTPFGIKADPGAILPYTKVTKYHYWCGSSRSGYYNQLVDSRVTGRSYTKSDEHLIDYKGVYNYCMFIDYNAEGMAGKGSCIFLHCKGKNKYTAGCVAIDEASMKKIIQWAHAGAKIVIQQS